MRIITLTQTNQAEVIGEASEILKRGGSIVYPTDTVYGLGVNPFDDFLVRRLFRIKKRPASKPVPLIVRSIAMAKKLAYINSKKEKILKEVWPGAVSVVLYKRDIVSQVVSSGTDTVSLRVPNSEFCLRLIRAFNSPITSTSANISSEKHSNDSNIIIERFKKELYKPDLIIDAGVLEVRQPSTVLDLSGEKPKINRIGPVKPKDLAKILGI